MQNVLSIQGIVKSYGIVKALKGVSFDVPKGSVFGVLGPNGSGKTTLLGILLDVLKQDAGQFNWIGYDDAKEARRNIGSLLETPNFYHYLSAKENLAINAEIKGRGHDQIDEVLKIVNLYERRNSPFSTFSLGMKQRLAIASALLGDPDILVFDEPTNGLDPVGITEIRNLILNLASKGFTIIMASHLLDEVEKVCTHVAILKLGELITTGPVIDVLNDQDRIEIGCANMDGLFALMENHPNIAEVVKGNYLTFRIKNEAWQIEDVNSFCYSHGFVLTHIQKKKKSLETKFMEITS